MAGKGAKAGRGKKAGRGGNSGKAASAADDDDDDGDDGDDGVPSYKVVNIELNDDGLTVAAAIVHKLQLQVEGVSVGT